MVRNRARGSDVVLAVFGWEGGRADELTRGYDIIDLTSAWLLAHRSAVSGNVRLPEGYQTLYGVC